MRPQPHRDDSDNLRYQPSLVNELLDYSLPRDRGPDALDWWPGRFVNADANVGDALCQLNTWVHALILEVRGWHNVRANRNDLEKLPYAGQRPYQSRYRYSAEVFVLFRPTGSAASYFQNYCSRINAAGNRPSGPFPGRIDLRQVDLGGAYLRGADLGGADLRGANLGGADLRGAYIGGADLGGADLGGANLGGANLGGADLGGADLHRTNLRKTNLEEARGLTKEQLALALAD